VRIHPDGWTGNPDHKAVEIAGPPARLALALLPYAALGIEEFMISGIDRPSEVARIGRETITLVANSLARRETEVPQPGAFTSPSFAEHRAG
jgi:alkanesulfonate monooxygenase